MRRKNSRAMMVMLLTTASLGDLHADEWAIESAVTVRNYYYDNIRLTPAPSDPVVQSTLSPEVALRKKTEISDISLRGVVAVNRYWGESSLDTTDQSYYLTSALLKERSNFGFDAAFIRDSTLRGELTETGNVTARTQRSSVRLSPQWSYNISPLVSTGASYGFSDVRYDSARTAGLTDYRNQNVSLWLARSLSEHDEIRLGTAFSKYETRPGTYKSDTLSASLNYSRDFSERTKLSSLVGVQRSKSSRQALTQVFVPTIFPGIFSVVLVPQQIDSDNTSMQLNIVLTSQWSNRTALRGRLSRELNPSGSGSLIETDALRAGITHSFSEQTTIDVDLSAYRTRFPEALLSAGNSQYYAFETRLNSRLDQNWSVSAGYSYARRDYSGVAGSADGNTVFVSARYDWKKIALSR